MGLKIPNLDKKDFEILMQESLAKLPSYSQEWTEYNLSDPGITILELLAWMGDIQSYRLNRVGEEHYRAFLKLLLLEEPIETVKKPLEEPFKNLILGESNGYAQQRFKLPPEVKENSFSQINVGNSHWKRANEFFSASPDSEIYMIENGWLMFGDGAYGKIPPRGKRIAFKSQLHPSDTPQPSELFDAFMNFREELMIPTKAVTLEDYEFLAHSMENGYVARAKAINSSENEVTVVVIFSDTEEEKSIEKVKLFLEKKKLLTTRVIVHDVVDYKSVYLKVQIQTEYANPLALKVEISSKLQRFFDSLLGGIEERGWTFGEDVYLAELYRLVYEMKGVDKIEKLILSDEKDGSALNRVSIEKMQLPKLVQLVVEVNSIKKSGVCDALST